MLLKLSFACPCSEGSRCWSNGLPTHPCLPSQWKRDTIPLWKTSALTATSQWSSQTFFLHSGLMFILTKRVPEQLVYRLDDALKTCKIHWPPLAQVTLFQLEKIYGKSSDAKAFIKELCRGSLAKSCVAKSKHIIYMNVQLTIICLWIMWISYLTKVFASIILPTKITRPRTTGGATSPGLEIQRSLMCSCLILSSGVAPCRHQTIPKRRCSRYWKKWSRTHPLGPGLKVEILDFTFWSK